MASSRIRGCCGWTPSRGTWVLRFFASGGLKRSCRLPLIRMRRSPRIPHPASRPRQGGLRQAAVRCPDPPLRLPRLEPVERLAHRGRPATLGQPAASPVEWWRAHLVVPPPAPASPEPVATRMFRLTGVDITRCPVCRAGRPRPSTRLTAGLVAVCRPGACPVPALDTS